MKLITIAIPTYNRCKSCIATVKNFISQIEKNNFENDVHIFISDNHSTDSTYEELLKLQAKYPELIEINIINECYRTPPAKKKFNKRLIFWQFFSAILAIALIIVTYSLYFKN